MSADTKNLTNQPGTYVLMLKMLRRRSLTIGQLGKRSFAPGGYAYVGSAFGPGGLRARIKRHLRSDKKCHWHIDYLTGAARVVGCWFVAGPLRLEHRWAADLAAEPINGLPVKGFGCSDCTCRSHLFYLGSIFDVNGIRKVLGAQWRPMADA